MRNPHQKKRLLLSLILGACLLFQVNAIDPPTFRYGFGGGINFSMIQEINSFPLYEDMSGATYESNYSPIFSNLGSQFFFHGEFNFNSIILAFKPGIYTYKFSKTDEVIFVNETQEYISNHLLRYIQMPLEAKWVLGNNTLKPFVGGELSPGYILRQGGSGNHSFIHPRISAGPIAGTYITLENFDIVFTAGYDYALHITTRKDDRYNTITGTSYSQSDIKQHNLNFSLSLLFSMGKSRSRKSLDCVYPNSRSPKKH
jgi:hypothetical protein